MPRLITGRCECDYTPSGTPSHYDSYEEGETRIPNPICPRHRESDELAPYDLDPADTLETFGIAWSEDRAEWVEADGIDEETGEPYTEESAA